MFYSHEILTSRKYGFATIWLVATMGSGTKKVSRRAILDVDITKTCDTIAAPTVPLALRLQSNLLYGVTRVYAQQCNYALQDVENTRSQMRAVLKIIHGSGLNPECTNKGRAEHLILGDDPSFLPDFDLTLGDLPLDFENEQYSLLTATGSIATGNSRRTSERSDMLQLGDGLLLGSLDSPSSVVRPTSSRRRMLMADTSDRDLHSSGFDVQPQYQGLQEDLGLMIGDDGNAILQEFTAARKSVRPSSVQPAAQGEVLHGDDLGWFDNANFQQMKIDHDVFPADIHDGERDKPPGGVVKRDLLADRDTTTSETAQAPLRAQKHRRIVPLDNTIELSRRDLKSQQEDYLANMLHGISHKQTLSSLAAARTNAAVWIYGDNLSTDNPLSVFCGTQLLSAVANIDFGTAHKRARDETPEPEITRRVRSRDGLDSALHDAQGDGYMPDYTDIEQGREQPTPLADMQHSTLLPWNQSTGSRRPASSYAANSIGVDRRPRFSQMQRYSRLETASPTAARAIPASFNSPGDIPGVTHPQWPIARMDEAGVKESTLQSNTQNGTESQWLRNALQDESMNFLAFVEDAITQRGQTGTGDVPHAVPSIDFDELLTVANNNYIVAAQAFLHVLVLGTKSLLSAEQYLPFGRIAIGLQ